MGTSRGKMGADGQTDRWVHRQADGWMDAGTDRRTHSQLDPGRWVGGQTDRRWWMDAEMDRWTQVD